MKIIKNDLKHNLLTLKIENEDDLYWLYLIIKPQDEIIAKASRKIKLGNDPNAKTVRKTSTIKIKVDKIKLEYPYLRILGIIEQGPEEFPTSSYQAVNLTLGDQFSIIKEKWLEYELKKINELSTYPTRLIGLVMFDRERFIKAIISNQSHFEILEDTSIEHQSKFEITNLRARGASYKSSSSDKLHDKLISCIQEFEKKGIDITIIATLSVWLDLAKRIVKENENNIKSKIIFVSVSSITRSAIKEVLKSNNLKKAISYIQAQSDFNLIDELLKNINQGQKYAYGFDDVKEAILRGAARILLISDNYIKRLVEKSPEEIKKLDELISLAESTGCQVHIMNSNNEAGKILDRLGGVGAILRY